MSRTIVWFDRRTKCVTFHSKNMISYDFFQFISSETEKYDLYLQPLSTPVPDIQSYIGENNQKEKVMKFGYHKVWFDRHFVIKFSSSLTYFSLSMIFIGW